MKYKMREPEESAGKETAFPVICHSLLLENPGIGAALSVRTRPLRVRRWLYAARRSFLPEKFFVGKRIVKNRGDVQIKFCYDICNRRILRWRQRDERKEEDREQEEGWLPFL